MSKSIFDIDLARLTRNRTVTLLCIIGLAAALFIPFLGRVHLFDWDEANFAEASREMIARGNYLQVTINYQPFWEKPPLYFWLQTLSMKAFGVNEFAARFVNALCGIFTLLIVFLVGRRVYASSLGLLWAMAFLGSFLPSVFFKSGIIDPVFNLLIFLGLFSIYRALLTDAKSRRAGRYALAGLFIGLATLAKGPVAFLVICLVMFVFWAMRRFKVFFSFVDIASFLVAVGGVAFVFFGIETLSHGTTFIREFILYQIRLLTTNDAGHGEPFYYHFFVILFGCFPASFFAIFSFFKRHEPAEPQQLFNRFMIILFWVVLVLFSIVKTKTVLYSSLTWFPVTYLAALYLDAVIAGHREFRRPLLIGLAVFTFLISLTITLFPILVMHKAWIIPLIKDKFAVLCLANPVHWSGFEFLIGIGFGCAAAFSLVLFVKQRFAAGALGLFLSCALCLLCFLYVLGPKIETYTQGGPVAFYQTRGKEDVYVRSMFKSYMDLFYSRVKPPSNPAASDMNWLKRGPIDKPVYFVDKATSHPELDTTLHLVKIATEYGYSYYRREVPGNQTGKTGVSSQ
jgi:4-amino-4-deoxy-L-arabinose transferase-like glycosyltransferase